MSDSLFCSLRKVWVAALPEEKVRQTLISKMVVELGYPIGHLVLEKSLHQLPHLQNQGFLPKRRADLIVFAKGLHPQHLLYPLLLVECKAIPLNDKVLRQIVGYNQFVKAYFIAVVNQSQIYLGYYHPSHQNFIFHQNLLPYAALLELAKAQNF